MHKTTHLNKLNYIKISLAKFSKIVVIKSSASPINNKLSFYKNITNSC